MPKKEKNLTYYEGIGRRRSAVARVRLYISKKPTKVNTESQKGQIFINDMPIEQYFPSEILRKQYMLPLTITESESRFAISITASGGGKQGQLEAVSLGLARALELADAENRKKLKPEGLLSRDSRTRERRKPGTGGRARRKKQSPKR
jgi:small subunit ribosomal protein S9